MDRNERARQQVRRKRRLRLIESLEQDIRMFEFEVEERERQGRTSSSA